MHTQLFKAEFFRALAHPLRVRILEVLGGGGTQRPGAAGDARSAQPLVPQQLAILRGKNIVTSRKLDATARYALSDPLITKLLMVAREIFNNHLVDTRATPRQLAAGGSPRNRSQAAGPAPRREPTMICRDSGISECERGNACHEIARSVAAPV